MGWRSQKRYTLTVITLAGVAIVVVAYRRAHSLRAPSSLPTTSSASSNDPHVLLAQADRLFWVFNSFKAAPLYERAEKLFIAQGDAAGALHARIGLIRARAETSSFPEISGYLAAQLRTPLVQHDPRLRLWCLAAKGNTDIEVDIAAAKQDWEEARKLAKSLSQDALANRASGELGLIAFLQGDSKRAAVLVGGALLGAMRRGDIGGQIRYLELLGNAFNELKRQPEAIGFYNRAIKIASETPDAGFPFMAYEGKGQALIALNRELEARAVLDEALKEALREQKRGHETQILILLGELALQSHNTAQAVEYLEQAGKVASDLGFYRMVAYAMSDLAHAYRDQGELTKAEDRLARGLQASRKVGDTYYVPRDLKDLADMKAKAGKTDAAHALYQQAEDVIDAMLLHVPGLYTESSLLSAMSDIYLGDFKLEVARGDLSGAFAVIERARGRTAVDVLRNRSPLDPEPPTNRTIEAQIASIQTRLMLSDDPDERSKLLDSLLEAEERLCYARDSLIQTSRRIPTHPIPLPVVQANLADGEAILEYVLAEPASFCFVISRKQPSIVVLQGGRKQIEDLVATYLAKVQAKKDASNEAKALYAVLIGRALDASPGTRLILVPDGRLHTLPFEALQDGTGNYLIRTHIISYAPSASTLYLLRASGSSQQPELAFLGVADVPYEGAPNLLAGNTAGARILRAVTRGIYDLRPGRLVDLPNSRQEVLDVTRELGPRESVLLLGPDATESAFKAQPLGTFKIIHLAVHAVATPDFPDRATLILGRDARSEDDGLLQAREIARLPLNADLVTLSACDTAKGKLQGEEGTAGLVQAFLVAGVKSVVAALWSVDDLSTGTLMKHFYAHLARKEDEASALRNAKLDLLNELGDRSPFYWAGFTLTGDGAKPITSSK
jgi:CHAT domain-containing protein